MNTKSLILAIVVGFVFVFVTDFVIHTIWLMPDYNATKSLWRSEAEMASHFPWMLGAQLLCAATFVLIRALGFASRGTFALALTYGGCSWGCLPT